MKGWLRRVFASGNPPARPAPADNQISAGTLHGRPINVEDSRLLRHRIAVEIETLARQLRELD